MGSILRPNLGFAAGECERNQANGIVDDSLAAKVNRAGVEAARRKFTPEFINRIDKTVVFHPLGAPELRKILTIELNMVQQRIFSAANAACASCSMNLRSRRRARWRLATTISKFSGITRAELCRGALRTRR